MTDPQQPTQEADVPHPNHVVERLAQKLASNDKYAYMPEYRKRASELLSEVVAAQRATAAPVSGDARQRARKLRQRLEHHFQLTFNARSPDYKERVEADIAAALQSERTAATDKARRETIEALTARSTLATILDHDTAADPAAVGIWFETPQDAEDFLRALTPQNPGDAAPERTE